jgi:hypothetical protein
MKIKSILALASLAAFVTASAFAVAPPQTPQPVPPFHATPVTIELQESEYSIQTEQELIPEDQMYFEGELLGVEDSIDIIGEYGDNTISRDYLFELFNYYYMIGFDVTGQNGQFFLGVQNGITDAIADLDIVL